MIKKITLTSNKQTFTPIAYNTFETSTISVEIEFDEEMNGDALNEIYETYRNTLQVLSEKDFVECQNTYFDRIKANENLRQNIQPETRPQLDRRDMQNHLDKKPAYENSDEIEFPANPVAKSLSDLVTAKQLGMIRALCRNINADADAICQTKMSCKTDEISKFAASRFIDYLQLLEKEGVKMSVNNENQQELFENGEKPAEDSNVVDFKAKPTDDDDIPF